MKPSLLDLARQADAFFMQESPIHHSLRRLARTLDGMGIPFAVAGALAVNAHGHRRTTEDLDVILTAEGLRAFKSEWIGRGWIEKHAGSRGFRDAVAGVPIDVLIAGEYPGDGKPKPVRLPDPETAAERDASGIPYLRLPVLLELKLASGMTAPDRPRDLDDVIQLIRRNGLPLDYGNVLDLYVREKYRELWRAAQHRDPE